MFHTLNEIINNCQFVHVQNYVDDGTSITIAAADADLTTSDPNHATSITIVNSASGKGKTKKKKKEPLKVVKNER